MTPLVRRFLEVLSAHLTSPDGSGYAGLRGAAVPYGLAALLQQASDRRTALLVPTESAAEHLGGILTALLGEGASPARLPAPDVDPYEGLPVHPGLLLDRAAALGRLALAPRHPVLLSAESLLWKVPRRGWWLRHQVVLEPGQALSPGEFRRQLWRLGYRKADLIGAPGEFSFRGGIVDLFPPTESLPVRLELFGDEVEQVRFFDVTSQRSLSAVGRAIRVPPLSEAIRDEPLAEAQRRLLGEAGEFGALRLEILGQVGTYPTWDIEVRVQDEFFGPLPELLGEIRWVVSDPETAAAAAAKRTEAWRASFRRHRRPGFLAPDRLFWSPGAAAALLAGAGAVRLGAPGAPAEPTERCPVFPGEPRRLLVHLGERVREGYRILALLQGHGTAERLRELAAAEGLLPLTDAPPGGDLPPGLYLAVAPVEEGVVFPRARWMTLCEKEVFGRGRVTPGAARREAFFSTLRDLKPGDAVVHSDHGVGLYRGIETLVRNGVREDFLLLNFAGGDRLLVPVQRMDLIQKYSGPEGHRPPLDKLGGATWKKTRDRVHRAVREIAGDLLQLYARRRTASAHAFGEDGEWQSEFEAAFPYELTPDQQRALEEVKRDMGADRPMDRVVCGDVGYGKTEVAMRAAFKAAAEGKQVAVLCPTTVLALQHYERFTQRFAPFPFRVAMLSRFVPPKEQKAVVRDAAAGTVDILVGTHRVLSKDVRLPELGLLIVDEEQRFGVAHKEKIKQAKHEVHVLTLTATPIPRTLQMGLSGILDMSLIQTAPRDRLAIETRVQPYDEELVAGALRRELSRQGQAFVVHNRVETIARCAARLRARVPEARFAVAHGQMGERALEEVMLAFFHGHYDVLVCTTIIENGVDLPRANTLVVEEAQDFGLCQLYQLRGRIGRSNLPAYAYLLTPAGTVATGDAARRLEALQEFAELGAGFRIAAVDLELRGAGTLLGAEQSGHMAAVGFELYMRMLEEAVADLKGEARGPLFRCELNLGLDLSVPMEYMEEVNQRLAFYRELSLVGREDDVDRIAADTADRFGPPPPAVLGLIEAARLRARAERCGVRSAARKGDVLHMRFDADAAVDTRRLLAHLSGRPRVRLEPSGALELPLYPGETPLAALAGVLAAALPAGERREAAP